MSLQRRSNRVTILLVLFRRAVAHARTRARQREEVEVFASELCSRRVGFSPPQADPVG